MTGPLLPHLGQYRLYASDRAPHVHVHHVLVAVDGAELGHAVATDARVVDEHVELSGVVENPTDAGIDLFVGHDVELDELDLDPCRLGLGQELPRLVEIPHARVHVQALAGQGVALGRTTLVADDLAAGRLVRPFEVSFRSRIAYWILTSVSEVAQEKIGEATGGGEAPTISGRDLFTLYDTFGFPLDLARDIADERGLQLDEAGFVYTGQDLIREGRRPKNWKLRRDPFLMETSVPGIFAAGDVRHGVIRRVASAVGQGAVAVSVVHKYLETV